MSPHLPDRTAAGLCILALAYALAMPAASQQAGGLTIGGIIQTNYERPDASDAPIVFARSPHSFRSVLTLFLYYPIETGISAFATLESWQGLQIYVYAMGLDWRPGGQHYFALRAGKFLAPFGNFLERRFASTNPLIGVPAAYAIFNNLSAFVLPTSNSALLRTRGTGRSLGAYQSQTSMRSTGALSPQLISRNSGLNVVPESLYLTGLQALGTPGKWRYALALTNGALYNPAENNSSRGLNLMARLVFEPVTGLLLGASFARGVYLDRNSVQPVLGDIGKKTEMFHQTTFSADAGYTYGHAQVWIEYIRNRYDAPLLAENLTLDAGYLEAKYNLSARFFMAARFSGVWYGKISDPEDVDADGDRQEPWDYPITLFELGLGYRAHRNAFFKLARMMYRIQDVPAYSRAADEFAGQLTIFF